MRLSDKDIHKYLDEGKLVIVAPSSKYQFDPKKQVQPCSIDLRLGNVFTKFKEGVQQFDVKDLGNIEDYIETFEYKHKEKIIINPNQIIFGQIYELLRLPPDCSGMIEGRSRFARLGISVHSTGGFINPEFEGAMPLQLINNNNIPIVIYPFMQVCQLILVKLTDTPLVPYPIRSDNPYHKETIAGSSISHLDPAINDECLDLPNLNYEIECRLVTNYYQQLKHDRLTRRQNSNPIENKSIPQSKGDTIFHIKKATIATINTGKVYKDIISNIQTLTQQDRNIELGNALKELTEFVDKAKHINEELKKEAFVLINEIAKNSKSANQNEEKLITIKSLTKHLGEIIKSFTSDKDFWIRIYSIISGAFGF